MTGPILIFSKWAPANCEKAGVLSITINLNAEGEIIFFQLKEEKGFETAAAVLAYRLGADWAEHLQKLKKPHG